MISLISAENIKSVYGEDAPMKSAVEERHAQEGGCIGREMYTPAEGGEHTHIECCKEEVGTCNWR